VLEGIDSNLPTGRKIDVDFPSNRLINNLEQNSKINYIKSTRVN